MDEKARGHVPAAAGRQGTGMTASAAQTDRWGIRGGPAQGVFPRSKAAAVIAVALTLGIFVVDTLTPYGFAVAVLYVIVVLLAGSFLRRRGVRDRTAGRTGPQ